MIQIIYCSAPLISISYRSDVNIVSWNESLLKTQLNLEFILWIINMPNIFP